MTEEITTSLLTRVLEWLPEHLRDRANNSSTLLNIILNEVSSDRDIRITGGAAAARAEAALIAAMHKMLHRQDGKRFVTLVVCPSRESEEIMTEIAQELTAQTELTVRSTALLRTKTIISKAFETPADIVLSSLHGIDKLLDAGVLQLEQVRTVIIDDIEWFEAAGDLRKLERFIDALPAARQLIGITSQGDIDERIVELLHAPSICRAPDLDIEPRALKERLIVVPKETLGDMFEKFAENSSILYLSDSPTESTRLVSRLKAAGHDPKRVTVTQTDTARKTLILKFTAGLVAHVITPSALLSGFQKASLKTIVHTEVPGGARPYLKHAEYLADEGELITIVTPDDLPLIESLLLSAQKKLDVENPTGIADLPEEVGQIVSRQKLTIRTDFNKVTDVIAEDATEKLNNVVDVEEEYREKRPFKRKNPRFNKNNKTKYSKKDHFQRKPRKEYENETSPSENDHFEEKSEDVTEKKHYKKRFPPYSFNKRHEKRPYRERREETPNDGNANPADETATFASTSTEVSESIESSSLNSERADVNKGEKTWRPKTKYNRFRKPYSKDRRQSKPEIEEDAKSAVAPVSEKTSESSGEDTSAKPKKFTKYPQKKRPYQPKAKKSQMRSRDDNWNDDDDNFGNSIHYQPRRQNLRTLRSDEPLHWEPSDPFHPSSQALSLPQMMPDENGYRRPNRSKNDHKGNFNRSRKPGFKKFRGSGEN